MENLMDTELRYGHRKNLKEIDRKDIGKMEKCKI
jgi:hypothetical protein